MSDAEHEIRVTELEREARAQVRRLVSGEATIADLDQAKRWREQSPAHDAALASAVSLWNALGPAGRNVLEDQGKQAISRPAERRQRLTRRAVVGGAVAAAVAYTVARPPFGIWPSLSELASDYRTATGEQRRIALPDGTLVQLNTQTSISLRAPERDYDRIELVAGEAAITLTRERARPLTVIAGGGNISAQGAAFNVRYYGGRAVCVTCVEGSLRLEHRAAELVLHGRQQATYGEEGLGQPKDVDFATVTAWQNGLLVFRDIPLSEVIAEINRYRRGRIVLMNAELGRQAISARFRIDNVNDIMALAQRVLGAKLTTLPGGIVLLS